tara:strand:+ start:630 stop:1679 length:1050 start_codon:yes stop_codon:yes gene_type:complete
MEKLNKEIDLSGFKMNDELNPKVWDDEKMKPEVRKTLLKIADDYFESLGLVDVDIEDVTMTGSLANYNWSKYSDVDLHILVDYKDIPVDEDLVLDFLKSKSSAWNKEHDIQIYGFDVELYVQDITEKHTSSGVYSVLNDEWNIRTEKQKVTIDKKSVRDKANKVMDRIEELYDDLDEDRDYKSIVKRAEKLTDKIKKMRQCGLDSVGEFSVENMAFKVLRRNGMLDRLYDIKNLAYDKSLTLESVIMEDGVDKIKESFKKFIEKLKTEGRETREAWNMVIKSIKEKKELGDDDKLFIKNQIGDVLKATGLTLASILPGGFVYILLSRSPKLKKYMLPSSFITKSEETKE